MKFPEIRCGIHFYVEVQRHKPLYANYEVQASFEARLRGTAIPLSSHRNAYRTRVVSICSHGNRVYAPAENLDFEIKQVGRISPAEKCLQA